MGYARHKAVVGQYSEVVETACHCVSCQWWFFNYWLTSRMLNNMIRVHKIFEKKAAAPWTFRSRDHQNSILNPLPNLQLYTKLDQKHCISTTSHDGGWWYCMLTTSCEGNKCLITLHHTTPHHTTPYNTTPHHTIQHHTTSYHTTPHHTTPHHHLCITSRHNHHITFCLNFI